jgi:hypothetical protein
MTVNQTIVPRMTPAARRKVDDVGPDGHVKLIAAIRGQIANSTAHTECFTADGVDYPYSKDGFERLLLDYRLLIRDEQVLCQSRTSPEQPLSPLFLRWAHTA